MDVEILAEGLHFGEGPRWHQGALWFSDFYDHAVKTVTMDGTVSTRFTLEDQPSGLGWMPDGRLLVVSMTERALLRMEYNQLVAHADLSEIATFHCNDMVVDAEGRAYVGNFGFDLEGEVERKGFAGAVASYGGATLARVDPDGSVHAAAFDLQFPNGSVITPDGGTLIVAETFGRRLTAFDIRDNGGLGNRRVWADLGRAMPDGITLDDTGAVWLADASGPRCIRVAEGGEVLATVETSNPCYACALGGPDGRTLFMLTAVSSMSSHAAAERTGRVEVCTAPAAHAGRP